MRRHRFATRRVSRGSDLTRVASLVMMLLVLGAMIRYTGNPDTWRWVEKGSNVWADEVDKDSSAKGAQGKPAPLTPGPSPARGEGRMESPAPSQGKGEGKAGSPAPSPAKVEAGAKTPAKPAPASPPEVRGPTDEDPEEADSAREEFQAVGDRTLVIQPEEMLAYKRMLGWVRNQSFEAMLKRAKRKVVYNDFVQSPDKFRGKLVALDLTAARFLKLDDPPEGDPIYENLYEMWGASNESGNWLYEAIAVNAPKGMPLGPNISERVRVVGYFFKLQAYQRAGAKVNEPPQVAPIFIGRLAWKEAVIPRVQSTDWLWGGMVAALFGIVTVVAVGIGLLRRRQPRVVQSVGIGTTGLTTDQWLDRAEGGTAPLDDNDPEDPEDEDSAS